MGIRASLYTTATSNAPDTATSLLLKSEQSSGLLGQKSPSQAAPCHPEHYNQIYILFYDEEDLSSDEGECKTSSLLPYKTFSKILI